MLSIRRRGRPSSRVSSRSAGGGHRRRPLHCTCMSSRNVGSGSPVNRVYGRRIRIFGCCGRALACFIAQFLDHCVLSPQCCMSGGAIANVMSPPFFGRSRRAVRSRHGIRSLCMPLETWPCQLTECGRLGVVDRYDHSFSAAPLRCRASREGIGSDTRRQIWQIGHVVPHS